MGVSTNGILWYGYHFDEGEVEVDKWEDLPESTGVTMGVHCSDSVPMYYLAIKSSELTAYRGSPKLVNPYKTAAHSGNPRPGDMRGDWDKELLAFAEVFGLPAPDTNGASELGWWLASYWG